MDTRSLYDAFRSEVFDLSEPYLWSSDDVCRYMTEAQQRLCIRAGGIADSTSAFTRLAFDPGDVFVGYDRRILTIRAAKLESTSVPVSVLDVTGFSRMYYGTDYGVLSLARMDNTPGEVKYVVTDIEAYKLRLYRIPVVADAILLNVYRLPLRAIEDPDQGALEVDPIHHNALIDGMKELAYLKPDAETLRPDLSSLHGARFNNYCKEAREIRERREYHTRVVAYGGL